MVTEQVALTSPSSIHPLWLPNRACDACDLRPQCNGPVPGEGRVGIRIMAVGEAPGRNEDVQGRPFVGQAGRELDMYLFQVGLQREDVYITNITKCRPVGSGIKLDWAPLPQHINICTSLWLENEIEMLQPSIILSLGKVATSYFLKRDVRMDDYNGYPQLLPDRPGIVLVPIEHPASALHESKAAGGGSKMRKIQEGFQAAKAVMLGTWKPPVDQFPTPQYLLSTKPGGAELLDYIIMMAQINKRVAVDPCTLR